jgi:asparagine N-glycosylation enzyme membrane subunit Stt3
MIVAATMFAPNVARSVLLAPRSGSLAGYWQDAMVWLRQNTPPPFLTSAGANDDYYFARYPHDGVPLPDYAVMNWWDQGYWLAQRARRVAVANPTQERAPNAARFYAETDEIRAVAIARQERARFVLSDWELPFRLTADRSVMGRFQSVLDWASATHGNYYEVYYRRDEDAWIPVWIFHAAYYQSMAYRLTVIGGAAATPANATSVLTFADRTDTRGEPFREVLTQNTYATYEAALQAAAATQSPQAVIAGLDPWQPAFPLQRLSSFVELHAVRTPEQKDTEAPWVRIFELRENSTASPLR